MSKLTDEIANTENEIVTALLGLRKARINIVRKVLLGQEIWTNKARAALFAVTYNGNTLTLWGALSAMGGERAKLRGRSDNLAITNPTLPSDWVTGLGITAPTASSWIVQFSKSTDIYVADDLLDANANLLGTGVKSNGTMIGSAFDSTTATSGISLSTTAGRRTLTLLNTTMLVKEPALGSVFATLNSDQTAPKYFGTVLVQGLEFDPVIGTLVWSTPAASLFKDNDAAFKTILGSLNASTVANLVYGITQISTQSSPLLNPYYPYTDPNGSGGIYVGDDIYNGAQQNQATSWNFDSLVTTNNLTTALSNIAASLALTVTHDPLTDPLPAGYNTAGTLPHTFYEDHKTDTDNSITWLTAIPSLYSGIVADTDALMADITTLLGYLNTHKTQHTITLNTANRYYSDNLVPTPHVRTYTGTDWDTANPSGLSRATLIAMLGQVVTKINNRLAAINTWIGTSTTTGSAKTLFDSVNGAINRNDGWIRDIINSYNQYDNQKNTITNLLTKHTRLQSYLP